MEQGPKASFAVVDAPVGSEWMLLSRCVSNRDIPIKDNSK